MTLFAFVFSFVSVLVVEGSGWLLAIRRVMRVFLWPLIKRPRCAVAAVAIRLYDLVVSFFAMNRWGFAFSFAVFQFTRFTH